MRKEEIDYSEYGTTKTYSLKIKNAKKVDEIAKNKKINKSKVLNIIIENYKEENN